MLLIACMLLTGCTQLTSKKDDGDITVKWLMLGLSKSVDTKPAFEKAAKIVKEKLGYNLEIVAIDAGDYNSKIQTLSAAGEEFDVMYTSNWLNDYYQNVAKGALIPLDDLLKETPDLYNSIPEYWWDSIKVDGKIYGVPNQQIATRSTVFLIPEKNIELLGLDMSKSNEIVTDYKVALDKIEEYLVAVKEKSGEYTNLGGIWNEGLNMFGFEQVLGAKIPGVVRTDGTSTKLINQYKTEEYKYYLKKRREWVKKGLVPPQSSDGRSLGKYKEDDSLVYPFMAKNATYKPSIESEMSGDVSLKVFLRTPQIVTNSGTSATLSGISATSKNPEAALKVIELVNSDKELYNTMSFGMEGIQYKKTGENRIELIGTDGWVGQNWSIGSVYNSYLLPDLADDTWEKTKEINDTAAKSKVLGFNPNIDKIKPQISACQSVIDEYFDVLDMGVVDIDSSYESFISKLDAAGVDKIFAEIQSQLDAWVKESK